MPKHSLSPCVAPPGVARRDVLRGMLALAVFHFPIAGCGGTHGASASPYNPDGRPIQALPPDARVSILWLEAGVCTGCSCSLLDADGSEALVPSLRLEFAETLMDEFGPSAVDALLHAAELQSGQYILVVDGAVPVDSSLGAYSALTTTGVDSSGKKYTVFDMIAALGAQAKQVVALGTCASFGGIPGSAPNAGMEVSLADAIAAANVSLSAPLIRIPGCPPNPVWAVDAITALVSSDAVPVDAFGRPKAHFSDTVHESQCPRRPSFDAVPQVLATSPGENTVDPRSGAAPCLLNVGCKGPYTKADCPKHPYQANQLIQTKGSSCIQAGAPCIGCASPGFLDARQTVDGISIISLEGTAATPFYLPTSQG